MIKVREGNGDGVRERETVKVGGRERNGEGERN